MSSAPRKVMCVFGTRPEVIKMAPVINELRRRADQFQTLTCATAQHRTMLDQALEIWIGFWYRGTLLQSWQPPLRRIIFTSKSGMLKQACVPVIGGTRSRRKRTVLSLIA